jgi:hypothetical protein
MAADPKFWNPEPGELFWPCDCTKEGWQHTYNTGPGLLHRQSRCTNCLTVAKFFRETREKQAEMVKDWIARTGLMSSWLAVTDSSDSRATIPRDIAEKIAGWDKLGPMPKA